MDENLLQFQQTFLFGGKNTGFHHRICQKIPPVLTVFLLELLGPVAIFRPTQIWCLGLEKFRFYPDLFLEGYPRILVHTVFVQDLLDLPTNPEKYVPVHRLRPFLTLPLHRS